MLQSPYDCHVTMARILCIDCVISCTVVGALITIRLQYHLYLSVASRKYQSKRRNLNRALVMHSKHTQQARSVGPMLG